MKILVVEDNSLMAQMVDSLLARNGFNVTVVGDGTSAIDMLLAYDFDAVVLDLRLNKESGLDVLRNARRRGINTPVLILSGDLELETKVTALTAGADDYLTKPFKAGELVARIQAVIRRATGHSHPEIRIGGLTLRLNDRSALVGETTINLTRKEFDLLEALALQKGRTLNKDAILSKLYGGRDEPDAKIIDVFVCKLRKKLAEALGGETLVRTVWGRGYMIDDPVCAAGNRRERFA